MTLALSMRNLAEDRIVLHGRSRQCKTSDPEISQRRPVIDRFPAGIHSQSMHFHSVQVGYQVAPRYLLQRLGFVDERGSLKIERAGCLPHVGKDHEHLFTIY